MENLEKSGWQPGQEEYEAQVNVPKIGWVKVPTNRLNSWIAAD